MGEGAIPSILSKVSCKDSDGLADSREAEEESKLCSVLNKSVLNERQCQAKAV